MIDSMELARRILDIIGQMHELRQPRIIPSQFSLSQVLEEIFWASLSLYEGRLITPRIYFAPEAALNKSERIVVLAEPQPLSVEAVRQLSPAQHRDGGFLTVQTTDGGLYIKGILGKLPFITVASTRVSPLWLCVEARGPGVLRISTGMEPVLEYSGGRIKQLGGMSFDSDSAEFLLMGTGLVTGDYAWQIARTIVDIGRSIEHQGYGGALWLLPAGSPIPRQLDGLGRRVEIQPAWWEAFREDWENRTSTIRLLNPGCDQGHEFLQAAAQQWDLLRRVSVLESISSLAGVDGAIVMNGSPELLAFNVICNAFSPPNEVFQATQPMSPLVGGKVVDRSIFGGSRHQSAINFCSTLSPAGAVVASHDGGLTVFASHKKGLVTGSKVSLIHSDSEVKTETGATPGVGTD